MNVKFLHLVNGIIFIFLALFISLDQTFNDLSLLIAMMIFIIGVGCIYLYDEVVKS